MATLLTLTSFEKSGLQLKVVRDSIFKRKNVSSLDRQRATALTNDIIRWMSVLDSMYTPFLKYPLKRLDPKVKAALRMGVYEGVIDSEVPPYAAINSAVETIKMASNKKAAGLVNAVLRKAIHQNPNKSFSAEKFSQDAFPHWLTLKWCKQFGEKETFDLKHTFMQQRPTIIRIDNEIEHVFEELKQIGAIWKPFPEFDNIVEIQKGGAILTKTQSFLKGDFSIQDSGSAAVSLLLDPKPKDIILDVCGAPGTKSFSIAHKMDGLGELYVSDSDSSRLKMAREGANRFNFNHIKWEQKDATTDTYPMADRILIDAPCTGTGVIGRKPDLKWRRNKKEIVEMNAIQKSILYHMSQFVKPNGIIVYATCSIEPEENWEVVNDFLKLNDDFKIESAKQWVPEKWIDENGCLFTFPSKHNADGIFACRLKRI